MNRTLKLLIFSDIFVLTGFALISPIMAIFIKENLIGGSVAAAGLATAITIIVRCSLQLVFAYIAKPKHRYSMLILGTSLIATVPFIYLFSSHVTHIYIASFVHGLGAGLANPAWFSLFANNLAKGRKGFEWAIYSSSVGFGSALAAFVGARLASKFGFTPVFSIVGIFVIMGCLILLNLAKEEMKNEMKLVSGKSKLHASH